MLKTAMSNIAVIGSGAAVLVLLSAFSARAEVLRAGGFYSGETTLESPTYGVTFTLPKDWIGTLPPESAFFLMKTRRPDIDAYIYAGIEKMTLEQARSFMQDDLDAEGGVLFHPRGEVQVEGSILSGEYSVTGTEKVMKGWVRTVVSEHGWAVSFLAQSTPEHAEILHQALDTICRSVELTEPSE